MVFVEVGARLRLAQEHLMGEGDENLKSPREEGVLSTQSDGNLSLLTPSNKFHHHMTNLHFYSFSQV
jgi:hypothetical protein